MTGRLYVLLGLAAVVFVAVLAGLRVFADPATRLRNDLKKTPVASQQDVFAKYLNTLKPAGILDVLEADNRLCHAQAHPVGIAIYQASRDLYGSIETCNTRCTGGCFHGVLTAAVKEFAGQGNSPATFVQVAAHARQICDDSRLNAVQKKGNCAHGIGHALMFLSGYRVTESVSACRRTFPEKPLQFYCAGGVYMERDTSHGADDAKGPSLLSPCDAESAFPGACYPYKMPHVFQLGKSVEQVADMCEGMGRYHRLGCFRGIGAAWLEHVARGIRSLADICSLGSREDQEACIDGTIGKLADYDPAAAERACASLSPELSSYCRTNKGYGMYPLNKPMEWLFAEPSPTPSASR
jgi:hypothetical protein